MRWKDYAACMASLILGGTQLDYAQAQAGCTTLSKVSFCVGKQPGLQQYNTLHQSTVQYSKARSPCDPVDSLPVPHKIPACRHSFYCLLSTHAEVVSLTV
jgi:hypothetical protein